MTRYALTLAVLLSGCAAPKPDLRPLSPQRSSRAPVANLAPAPKRLWLKWDNEPMVSQERYEVRVQASQDLRHWTEVARLPYQEQGEFPLTNRPAREFYRVVNCVKP